ncbi:MAG: hypothetical protein ABUS49_00080 [Acidobacteriota bacterium]
MFFRRERVTKKTFDDYLSAARAAGFQVESAGGKTRIGRDGIAAFVENGGTDADGHVMPRFTVRAGVAVGDEIATLTDGGFQKFFVTPHGKRLPAQAHQLVAVQNFQEDLKEAFGMTSLYNEALGTVSNKYLYDRVEGRDKGTNNKPWDVHLRA